jgi:hypothetical protein
MASPNLTLQGGNFQNASGVVIAGGKLVLQLSHDENYASGPAQIVGEPKFSVILDSNGNIPTNPAFSVYSNDTLTPAGSFYIVRLFDATGAEVWASPQLWTLTSSPNPLNVATIVPASPPGAGLGGGGTTLQLQTNEVNNGSQSLLDLHAGSNITLTDNGSGRVTVASTGGGTFSTSNQGWFAGPGMTDLTSLFAGPPFLAPITSYSANVVIVNQFVLQSSWTLSKVAYQASSAGAGGSTFNFGIYNAAGSLLLDSGAFNGASTSVQTLSFTATAFAPGTYFFAASASDTGIKGPVMQAGATTVTTLLAIINATTPLVATAANAASGGALPATLGTLTGASALTWVGVPLAVWKV